MKTPRSPKDPNDRGYAPRKEEPIGEHGLPDERNVPPGGVSGPLDEDALPGGIQTGQTSRGSYGTDQSTGAGGYLDRRSGSFSNTPVAQPGNDNDEEPDPVDPKL